MQRFRVIPTLLIEKDYLVKSKRFKNNRYVGDPINALKIFNEKEVDEIIILDISASKEGRAPNFKLIEELAAECFMPLSYGGGVNSLEQAKQLFRCGVEKIILNSACISNPLLIKEITQNYGSQSVTISIDVKKNTFGNYNVYSHANLLQSTINPISFALEMEKLGAGEIMINSVDNDGTYKGYDTEIIRQISLAVSVPVIASGGAGKLEDFKYAIESGASAVAAGSLFCFYGTYKAVLINYPSQDEIQKINLSIEKNSMNGQLKVIHFTAWYPNKYDSHKALFIKENFDSINDYCSNHLLHIDTKLGQKKIGIEKFKQSKNEETIIFRFPFKIWFLTELISFILLLRYSLKKNIRKNYDVVNFHIAYPLGVYIRLFNKIFKKPVVISEHWTAYHYNFYILKYKRGINRIKKIFKQGVPVIVVSEALANDIEKFSHQQDIRFHLLYNIVDSEIFNCYNVDYPANPTFFMLNMWSKIKQPFVGIDAFEQFLKKYPDAKLRIGGFGPMWKQIERYITMKKLNNSVELLGKLGKKEVAYQLNNCTALLHTSKYETFSVISAEAVSCGTPVIALNLGGIPSFVNKSNGYLHNNSNVKGWLDGMEYVYKNKDKFNKKEISESASKLFSKKDVGERYYKILKEEFKKYFELQSKLAE
jgi:cyclase